MAKTPEQATADAANALVDIGVRRKALIAQLTELDAELRPLVKAARANKVHILRVHDLTQLAPATIQVWAR